MFSQGCIGLLGLFGKSVFTAGLLVYGLYRGCGTGVGVGLRFVVNTSPQTPVTVKTYYRGQNNYQYYFGGVPYYNRSEKVGTSSSSCPSSET